ncbi:MAG: hypothetical protein HZC47_07975 [Methanobacterium sp.]|uniref:hypothetical protein n=1 Tax=Methanobacterium sp. TaxID=2164 RepID=UPI003D65A967|nr:hypothetical protein [Methanobacterium sp.]
MKPETEAKAIVALIISLIAFGCGSGAGIVMGLSTNDMNNLTKVNTSQEMPQIQTTKNVNIETQPQTTPNTDQGSSQTVYIENKNNGGNTNTTPSGNGTTPP